jgi:hypothetical protein
MPSPSLEEIQEEFADLDLPVTDGDVLERLQVSLLSIRITNFS